MPVNYSDSGMLINHNVHGLILQVNDFGNSCWAVILQLDTAHLVALNIQNTYEINHILNSRWSKLELFQFQ